MTISDAQKSDVRPKIWAGAFGWPVTSGPQGPKETAMLAKE